MALDDAGEKTEAPTPRRRQEARERGQVAKSHDLTAAAALLGAMLILNFAAPGILRELVELTRAMLGYEAADGLSADSMPAWGHLAFQAFVKSALPVCLAMTAVALIVTLAQVGLLFTFHPIKPDLQKIDPIAGFTRIFSMQAMVILLMGVFKIALIAAVAFLTIKGRLIQIVNMTDLSFWEIVGLSGELMFILGIRLAAVLLVLAILDYAYQRHRHEQNLRMTKQELKEELRRLEGDPLIRERRRRVARQLALQRMQAAVPKADVVITNPTHVAVALRYDAETMAAPKVVAKGAELLAHQIRKLAVQHGVPIVERAPLARALYKSVEVGQEIPPAFYKAVAEVLAYVYELSGKAVAGASAAAGRV